MHTNAIPERGLIANYVSPRVLAADLRAALRGLGYALIPACAMGRFDDTSWRPALRIVDERQYDRIPDPSRDPNTPIVLVTGSRALCIQDERIAGRISRPIQLDCLYPILQRTLEPTPRGAPRAPTRLSARGLRGDHRWVGSVTSLSINGCYLESPEKAPVGSHLSVEFALPRNGIVVARAICVSVHADGIGLEFSDISEDTRREIGSFVSLRLATL